MKSLHFIFRLVTAFVVILLSTAAMQQQHVDAVIPGKADVNFMGQSFVLDDFVTYEAGRCAVPWPKNSTTLSSTAAGTENGAASAQFVALHPPFSLQQSTDPEHPFGPLKVRDLSKCQPASMFESSEPTAIAPVFSDPAWDDVSPSMSCHQTLEQRMFNTSFFPLQKFVRTVGNGSINFASSPEMNCNEFARAIIRGFWCALGASNTTEYVAQLSAAGFFNAVYDWSSASHAPFRCSAGTDASLIRAAATFVNETPQHIAMKVECDRGANPSTTICPTDNEKASAGFKALPLATKATLASFLYMQTTTRLSDGSAATCPDGIFLECGVCFPYIAPDLLAQPYFLFLFPALKFILVKFVQLFIMARVINWVRKWTENKLNDTVIAFECEDEAREMVNFTDYFIQTFLGGGRYRIRSRVSLVASDSRTAVQQAFEMFKDPAKRYITEEDGNSLISDSALHLQTRMTTKYECMKMCYQITDQLKVEKDVKDEAILSDIENWFFSKVCMGGQRVVPETPENYKLLLKTISEQLDVRLNRQVMFFLPEMDTVRKDDEEGSAFSRSPSGSGSNFGTPSTGTAGTATHFDMYGFDDDMAGSGDAMLNAVVVATAAGKSANMVLRPAVPIVAASVQMPGASASASGPASLAADTPRASNSTLPGDAASGARATQTRFSSTDNNNNNNNQARNDDDDGGEKPVMRKKKKKKKKNNKEEGPVLDASVGAIAAQLAIFKGGANYRDGESSSEYEYEEGEGDEGAEQQPLEHSQTQRQETLDEWDVPDDGEIVAANSKQAKAVNKVKESGASKFFKRLGKAMGATVDTLGTAADEIADSTVNAVVESRKIVKTTAEAYTAAAKRTGETVGGAVRDAIDDVQESIDENVKALLGEVKEQHGGTYICPQANSTPWLVACFKSASLELKTSSMNLHLGSAVVCTSSLNGRREASQKAQRSLAAERRRRFLVSGATYLSSGDDDDEAAAAGAGGSNTNKNKDDDGWHTVAAPSGNDAHGLNLARLKKKATEDERHAQLLEQVPEVPLKFEDDEEVENNNNNNNDLDDDAVSAMFESDSTASFASTAEFSDGVESPGASETNSSSGDIRLQRKRGASGSSNSLKSPPAGGAALSIEMTHHNKDGNTSPINNRIKTVNSAGTSSTSSPTKKKGKKRLPLQKGDLLQRRTDTLIYRSPDMRSEKVVLIFRSALNRDSLDVADLVSSSMDISAQNLDGADLTSTTTEEMQGGGHKASNNNMYLRNNDKSITMEYVLECTEKTSVMRVMAALWKAYMLYRDEVKKKRNDKITAAVKPPGPEVFREALRGELDLMKHKLVTLFDSSGTRLAVDPSLNVKGLFDVAAHMSLQDKPSGNFQCQLSGKIFNAHAAKRAGLEVTRIVQMRFLAVDEARQMANIGELGSLNLKPFVSTEMTVHEIRNRFATGALVEDAKFPMHALRLDTFEFMSRLLKTPLAARLCEATLWACGEETMFEADLSSKERYQHRNRVLLRMRGELDTGATGHPSSNPNLAACDKMRNPDSDSAVGGDTINNNNNNGNDNDNSPRTVTATRDKKNENSACAKAKRLAANLMRNRTERAAHVFSEESKRMQAVQELIKNVTKEEKYWKEKRINDKKMEDEYAARRRRGVQSASMQLSNSLDPERAFCQVFEALSTYKDRDKLRLGVRATTDRDLDSYLFVLEELYNEVRRVLEREGEDRLTGGSLNALVAQYRGKIEALTSLIKVVKIEREVVTTVFGINNYVVALSVIYGAIFLGICGQEAALAGEGFFDLSGSKAWLRYEHVFARFLNSGTPASLIAAATVNIFANAEARRESKLFAIADYSILTGSLILALPATITHLLPACAAFIWIVLIVLAIFALPTAGLLFLWNYLVKRAHSTLKMNALATHGRDALCIPPKRMASSAAASSFNTGDTNNNNNNDNNNNSSGDKRRDKRQKDKENKEQERLDTLRGLKAAMTGICVWAYVVFIILVTAATQTFFNWAFLMYHADDFGLSYKTVPVFEFDTRRTQCYAVGAFASTANTLQFVSSFIG